MLVVLCKLGYVVYSLYVVISGTSVLNWAFCVVNSRSKSVVEKILIRSVAETGTFVRSKNGTRVVTGLVPKCGLLAGVVKPRGVFGFSINLSRLHFGLSGSKTQSTKFISSASQMASAHVPRQICIEN